MSSARKVVVSQSALEGFQSYAKDYATHWVRWCGEKYNFDADLVLKDLAKLDVSTEIMATIQQENKPSKTGKQKSIPIPFNPNNVSQETCQALVFNDGLFTQCDGAKDGESFCSKCLGGELVDGVPVCGTIQQRLDETLMGYKDLKGRKVKHYTEVLKKRKCTLEQAKAFLAENNKEVPEEHLVLPAKVERRGRPKKEKKEIVSVSPVTDIFEELAKSSDAENESLSDSSEVSVQSPAKESAAEKKAKKEAAEAEKKVKKEAAEAEKKAKKDAAEAEKKAKKDAAEAEKKAKKQAAEAEKKAKKEAAEAEKKANKEQKNLFESLKKAEKEAKKAEKEAKKAEKESKKAEKESKKAEKEVAETKEPVKETIVEDKVEDKVEEEEEPKKVKVKRVEIDGKKYLKTHDNVLYDEATSEVVGTFDEESNTIKPYEEEEEIEEEDYEED